MKSLLQRYKSVLASHPRLKKAQSFLELAVILPVLLLILLGVIELSFMVSQYLDMLDLTREAARFASVRDPHDYVAADQNCSTPGLFDFYYDTACIFSPPAGTDGCDPLFCNGLNPFVLLNPATDDVVITVFSVSDEGAVYEVKDVWPKLGIPTGELDDKYWALSNNDTHGGRDDNWKEDCEGNIIRTEPYYTLDLVTSKLVKTPISTKMVKNKGYVAVELYYCYHQVLQLPFFSTFVSDPMRLHAYTFMSLPAAAPTPTPRPTP
jgi:hypothetical protein